MKLERPKHTRFLHTLDDPGDLCLLEGRSTSADTTSPVPNPLTGLTVTGAADAGAGHGACSATPLATALTRARWPLAGRFFCLNLLPFQRSKSLVGGSLFISSSVSRQWGALPLPSTPRQPGDVITMKPKCTSSR